MATIQTSKGGARLRPMLGKDELILADLADLEAKGEASAYYSVKGRMLRALDAGTQSTDWKGGFGELPASEVLVAFVSWNTATDEDAIPEADGSDSPSQSPSHD